MTTTDEQVHIAEATIDPLDHETPIVDWDGTIDELAIAPLDGLDA